MCQKHVIKKGGKVVPNYDLEVQKVGGGEEVRGMVWAQNGAHMCY